MKNPNTVFEQLQGYFAALKVGGKYRDNDKIKGHAHKIVLDVLNVLNAAGFVALDISTADNGMCVTVSTKLCDLSDAKVEDMMAGAVQPVTLHGIDMAARETCIVVSLLPSAANNDIGVGGRYFVTTDPLAAGSIGYSRSLGRVGTLDSLCGIAQRDVRLVRCAAMDSAEYCGRTLHLIRRKGEHLGGGRNACSFFKALSSEERGTRAFSVVLSVCEIDRTIVESLSAMAGASPPVTRCRACRRRQAAAAATRTAWCPRMASRRATPPVTRHLPRRQGGADRGEEGGCRSGRPE